MEKPRARTLGMRFRSGIVLKDAAQIAYDRAHCRDYVRLQH